MSDAIGLAALLAVGLLITLLWATVATAWFLTHPPRRTYASMLRRNRPGDPSELDPPRAFDAFSLMLAGTRVEAWSIPGDAQQGPIAIVTHGWGDGKVGALTRLEALTPTCSRIIAWDLPGHGDSGGRCTLGLEEPEILVSLAQEVAPGSPVLLFGWSLGGGVSIVAARSLEGIVGVVVEAPYRLARTPAHNVLWLRRLPRVQLGAALSLIALCSRRSFARFDRAEHARGLGGVPLVVLHGTRDEVCPIEDGTAIADAGGGRLLAIEGGTHNDLWSEKRVRTLPSVMEAIRGIVERTR